MPFYISRLKLPLLVALLISLFALASQGRNLLSKRTLKSAAATQAGVTAAALAHLLPQRQRPRSELESELVTITPTGFEPNTITRPQGPFTLAVDNQSGLERIQLQLLRETGEPINVLRVPARRLSWRETIDFPAGRYILTEANHPRWRCTITITAR